MQVYHTFKPASKQQWSPPEAPHQAINVSPGVLVVSEYPLMPQSTTRPQPTRRVSRPQQTRRVPLPPAAWPRRMSLVMLPLAVLHVWPSIPPLLTTLQSPTTKVCHQTLLGPALVAISLPPPTKQPPLMTPTLPLLSMSPHTLCLPVTRILMSPSTSMKQLPLTRTPWSST